MVVVGKGSVISFLGFRAFRGCKAALRCCWLLMLLSTELNTGYAVGDVPSEQQPG